LTVISFSSLRPRPMTYSMMMVTKKVYEGFDTAYQSDRR
jgi:hypothetical protein